MTESIAHYDILGLMANGALGSVYRARDTRAGRTVAIRVLTSGMSDPAQRARAIDLIQPCTALSHPHVATLFEVGEQRGSVYLVYEFVPGDKLAALIDERPMSLRRALDLAAQMADALAEAHALGLVHGALTPSSVVVTPKGHVKILDFGLHAAVKPDSRGQGADQQDAADRQAARIDALGRSQVAYTAPEQILGQPPDLRADLFALGAVLYEMLTGRHAFSGRTPVDLGVHVLQTRSVIPSVLNPELPRELDTLVMKALAKKPDARHQSAAEMAAGIRAIAARAQSQAAAMEEARENVPLPRSPWRIAALLTLLVAAAAVGVWQWQEPLRQAWQGKYGAQPEPLLVVLPFHVAGTDLSRPYYGAGFAEDLARRLGQIPGITVLGRSTIRASAGKSPQAVAASVHANLAITGSLTPADDDWTALQVEARLIDRRDARVIWTGSYATKAQDVVALQASITNEVAAWLRIAYQPTAEHGRASLRLVNPSAYDKYLQARDAMASNDASRAAQLFQGAAAEDPSLIEAQAGLAEALYTAAAFEGREHSGDVQPRIREAAEAAFTADPDHAVARFAMGLAAPTWREALEHLKRAIEIDRSYVAAYLAVADILRLFDSDRAARIARLAAELDPGQPLTQFQLASDSLSIGDLNGALLAATHGQALAPGLPWWEAIKLRVRLAPKWAGVRNTAQNGRDAGDFPPGTILRGAEMGTTNRTADALTLLGSLSRLHPGSCEARAITAAVLFRAGRRAEGSRLAAEIAAKADSAPPGSGWARCAVMAAAAVDDAPRASAVLGRIASSERELRAWGAVNALLDGQSGLRQGVFPWSNVAEAPAVIAAMKRLDAALVRARGDAAKVLEGM